MGQTYGGLTSAQWQELSDAGFGSGGGGGGGGTEARIRSDYPAVAWMLDIKELKPLMLGAFGKDTPFDQQKFNSDLWDTKWWKSHGQSSRDWQRLVKMDPAQARVQMNQGAQMLSRKLGLPLHQTGHLRKLAQLGIMLDLDEATLFETAVNMIGAGKVPGAKLRYDRANILGKSYTQIGKMGKDYMVDVGHKRQLDIAMKVAAGRLDMTMLDEFFQRQAKSRWGHLSEQIEAGITPSEFFQGHRAAIAQLLEYGSADQVDLMDDKKWGRVTGFKDPQGDMRPMTVSETQTFVRNTDAWGETRNAKEEASTVAETIMSKFGAVK